MSDKISTTVAIDTTQAQANIKKLNSNIRVLESTFKANVSELGDWSKSIQGNELKIKSLNAVIASEKEKLANLEEILQKTAEAYGEDSTQVAALKVKINNLKASIGAHNTELNTCNDKLETLRADADNAGTAVDDMGDDVDDAKASEKDMETATDSLSSKLKDGLKVAAEAAAAAIAAVSAAAVAMAKNVVEAFGDYEQNVGGIETLYGEDAVEVLDNADNAFKTAGLSANEYMETVTSFSASLISSLGGDTAAATEYADMAITDMSDNANKMGTDMESIQNAYQGFAKQNYTMLDNLKLGYGGTKEEMERLLADAGQISGKVYNIDSYADVLDAIHIIQSEMGITGTTALEADSTIEGSLSALQGAYQNFVTGLGRDDADMEQLTSDMIDAFLTTFDNITPVIENLVAALPTVISKLITSIGDILPDMLPVFMDLFNQILSLITDNLPDITSFAVTLITTLAGAIIDNLPALLDALTQVLSLLLNSAGDLLPGLLASMGDILSMLIAKLPDVISAIAQALSNVDWTAVASALGDAIVAIVTAVVQNVPALVAALGQVAVGLAKAIWEAFQGLLPDWLIEYFQGDEDVFNGGTTGDSTAGYIVNEMANSGTEIDPDSVYEIPAAMAQAYREEVLSAIGIAEDELTESTKAALDAAQQQLENSLEANGDELNSTGIAQIRAMAAAVINDPNVPADWEATGDYVGLMTDKGIAEGIAENESIIAKAVANACGVALETAQDALSIHSPSRVARDLIGKNFALGIAAGIGDGIGAIGKASKAASLTAANGISNTSLTVNNNVQASIQSEADADLLAARLAAHNRRIARGYAI